MITLWNTLVYFPLLNLMYYLISLFPDGSIFGGIILLTIIIKVILYPFARSAFLAQVKQKKIQPLLKKIQEQYKDDKETQTKKTIELMKEQKANPFSSCLIILIQLPIFIAVYHVAKLDFTQVPIGLYESIASLSTSSGLNTMFAGIDLSKPVIFLAAVGGIIQFIQIYLMMKYQKGNTVTKGEKTSEEIQMEKIQSMMMYFVPVMIVIVIMSVPSLVAIYLITSSLLGIVQDYIIFKTVKAD